MLLEPEMGGARSLLAYTSHGVLVARSDTASARLGHGLSREELEWLRARVLHVMRDRRERRGGSARPAPPPVFEPELPYAFPLLLPALGLGIGALLGNAAHSPLAVCIDAPFLEHVLNVGGLLGLAGGVALDPTRRRLGGWRGFRGPLLGALALAGIFLALDPAPGWLQHRPWHRERSGFVRHEPVSPRFFLGWLPTAAVLNVAGAEAAAWVLLHTLARYGARATRRTSRST